jgi:hypothetical protein
VIEAPQEPGLGLNLFCPVGGYVGCFCQELQHLVGAGHSVVQSAPLAAHVVVGGEPLVGFNESLFGLITRVGAFVGIVGRNVAEHPGVHGAVPLGTLHRHAVEGAVSPHEQTFHAGSILQD